MSEKIMARIAEVRTWGELAEYLDRMTADTKTELAEAEQSLQEARSEGEDIKSSWRYREVQEYKAKLVAFDSIRATILKVMG